MLKYSMHLLDNLARFMVIRAAIGLLRFVFLQLENEGSVSHGVGSTAAIPTRSGEMIEDVIKQYETRYRHVAQVQSIS
jgi:hypothetical protein